MHPQDREASLKLRCAGVKADGEKIHSLIKENLDYFQASEDSEDWRHYIEYVDDIVVDGFFECVACSLHYLLANMDKDKSALPFMEAKLELQVKELMWGVGPNLTSYNNL